MTTDVEPARPYRGVCPSCGCGVTVFGLEVEVSRWLWWSYFWVPCPTNRYGIECAQRVPVKPVEVAK
jgi:hypothetical protein